MTRGRDLTHSSNARSRSPAQLPSSHAHQPTGRSQEPNPHPAGEAGRRARPAPLTTVFPSPLQCKRQYYDPAAALGQGPEQGRGPETRDWPRGVPPDSRPLPCPPRTAPNATNNLCFKNTCRHGCASRVENVGVEMVRFQLLRPGTRLDRGGVGVLRV